VVEHLLAKEKVAGSIPVSRSMLSEQREARQAALCGQAYTQPTQDIDHNVVTITIQF
jgi:hypothetical protein